jgi:tetratricopeptide (TPR) repeat protein
MPLMPWKTWSHLAVAGCVLLGVVACAPNSARTPLEPGLAAGEDRYDTLLRLGSAARAAGDPAAAVSMYQRAIAQNRGRGEAYVLLGDALVEMKAYEITVRFVSQLISATRDKAGAIINGDPQRIKEVTDIWTFSRDVSSAKTRSNPNWRLIATQSPA